LFSTGYRILKALQGNSLLDPYDRNNSFKNEYTSRPFPNWVVGWGTEFRPFRAFPGV
jgi:hypothetical protein